MEAVKFENVKFSYREEEDEFAVNGVTLSIEEGQFVAVLGRNGSGKSTLAKMINALLVPTEGSVTVFGLDASDPKNTFEIRKSAGMVFQNPDNQTVASIVEDDVAFGPENIGVPREEIGKRIAFGRAETAHRHRGRARRHAQDHDFGRIYGDARSERAARGHGRHKKTQ